MFDKYYTPFDMFYVIALTLILVGVLYVIKRLVGPGQQRVVDRPRFVHLEHCRVIDKVLQPGDKIEFYEKTVRISVLAKSIEVIEYNPEVGKTRVFCRHVNGASYEVWYVTQTPERVYQMIEDAYYGH
jgi:hypothetical protein